MKLILKFMKPYKKLFALTLILLFVDVIGALYIPTLVADMMNKGAAGTSLNALYTTGFQIAIASILSGIGAIWGGYTCASLASKVCRDIRNAIYEKSLTLSIYDFKQFGTAGSGNFRSCFISYHSAGSHDGRYPAGRFSSCYLNRCYDHADGIPAIP